MKQISVGQALPRTRYRSKSEIAGWFIATPILLAMLWFVATNERFEWGIVAQYLTAPAIISGVGTTLLLTFLCMGLGVVLGVILAVMVRSQSILLNRLAGMYIWFFRGTPLLVQLIFWFNLAALLPNLGTGAGEFDVNALITPFTAAVLGLALNEAAYMAEIVRGGLLSVDEGQKEAAEALGMRPHHVLVKVILPQAMRAIIPPTGNQTVGMLKNTSLVSVLGASELLHNVQIIYGRTYETIPLLLVACVWYLAMTTVLSIGQLYLEKYYNKSAAGNRRAVAATPSPLFIGDALQSELPITAASKKEGTTL